MKESGHEQEWQRLKPNGKQGLTQGEQPANAFERDCERQDVRGCEASWQCQMGRVEPGLAAVVCPGCSVNSPSSHKSQPDQKQRPIIPPRGDDQTLLSWQKAEVVYDIAFRFAHKFLSKGDRTVDQMIQSARSCK